MREQRAASSTGAGTGADSAARDHHVMARHGTLLTCLAALASARRGGRCEGRRKSLQRIDARTGRQSCICTRAAGRAAGHVLLREARLGRALPSRLLLAPPSCTAPSACLCAPLYIVVVALSVVQVYVPASWRRRSHTSPHERLPASRTRRTAPGSSPPLSYESVIISLSSSLSRSFAKGHRLTLDRQERRAVGEGRTHERGRQAAEEAAGAGGAIDLPRTVERALELALRGQDRIGLLCSA